MTASEKANALDSIVDVVSAPLALAATAYVIQLLWNALVPGLFHLSEIGFWQALGLRCLVSNLINPLQSSKKD